MLMTALSIAAMSHRERPTRGSQERGGEFRNIWQIHSLGEI
jgi:hypothetical protein